MPSVCERQDALTLHRLAACSRTDSLRDWFHAAALRSVPDVWMLTAIAPARALHAQSIAPGLHLALLPVQMTLPPRHLTSCRMYSIVSPTLASSLHHPSSALLTCSQATHCCARALTTYLTFKLDADTDSSPALTLYARQLASLFPTCDPPCLLVPVALTQPPLPSSHHPSSSRAAPSSDRHEAEALPGSSQTLSVGCGTARSPIDFIFIILG
jgi:hypothetical protein